jgi:ATP-dependent RNA helicase RhlE
MHAFGVLFTQMTFDQLGLAPALLKAVHDEGYTEPTLIQQQAIPAVIAGRDLLGGSQTGSGKTAAFALPILHKLAMSRSATNKFGGTGIRVLVLTPTRELAAQVQESFKAYGKYLQLSSTVVFGGVGMNPQVRALKQGVDILVATPGRLLDLQGQGFVDLSTVQMLVLDEADRMLDMGFIHDVKKVLAVLPKAKQSLLFSATFSDEIRDLAQGLLNNPEHIQVTPRNTTVQRITQIVHPVGRELKKSLLKHIIEHNNWSQVLVFVRTKFGANHVAEYLEKHGIKSMALHGNKSQGARTQALQGFKDGTIRALVATDIAARGIDIEELPHVVNYEIPNVSEDYVHRIGRTGRAGREGHAVSLVCRDEEGFMQDIERFTKQNIEKVTVPGFEIPDGEQGMPIAMGRQTLWGGLGKPPSREVMAAAAKNARREMMQRIQEKRATEKSGSQSKPERKTERSPRPQGEGQGQPRQDARRHPAQPGQPGRNNGPRPAQQNAARRQDKMPRQPFDPKLNIGQPVVREIEDPLHIPDPLRTSVDAQMRNSRGGQGRGNGGGNGGGNWGNRSNSGAPNGNRRRNGGGGGGGNRSAGGQGRARPAHQG